MKRPEDFGGVSVRAEKNEVSESQVMWHHLGWFVLADKKSKVGHPLAHDTFLNGSLQFACFPDRGGAEGYRSSLSSFGDNYEVREITEDYAQALLVSIGHKID